MSRTVPEFYPTGGDALRRRTTECAVLFTAHKTQRYFAEISVAR